MALLAAGMTAMLAPASASAADAIYGVTAENRLVRFTSEAPAAALGNTAITGLAANERVVALDVRPQDDTLVAVTSANRALQVNPVTGATRPAYGPFSPALSGQNFGADFDPVGAGALRIVSDGEQNLRVTSAATLAEGALAYPAGDAGAGSNPSVAALAYTNSTPGATSTTAYGIDTARDALVRLDPPPAGTLHTVGALGVDAGEPAGFDIAPAGNVAYAALKPANQDAHRLYRVNLANGRATEVRENAPITLPSGAGALTDIAVAGSVPDDNTRPQLSVAFSSTILEQNTDVLRPSVTCNETCFVEVRAKVQGRRAGTGTATIVGPGRATVRVPLDSTARRRIARPGTELISLDITATDAAGNRATQNNRVSRTQTLAVRRRG
jgi:hypothetical protein